MWSTSVIAVLSATILGATAQLSTYDVGSDDIAFAVNIPSSTSSSDSGSVYIQLAGSTSLSWVAVGQGSSMTGSNMMIIYAASDSNVTLSPRLGTGHNTPDYNSAAEVTLLEGTGISDGVMTANIRCDTCLSWSGGSMDPTSSSSNWIWASKSGDALDSTDTSADISQHDNMGTFTFDLTKATGGDSANPFISTSTSGSATASASSSTATSSSSSGSSSSGSGSSGSSSSSTSDYYAAMRPVRIAHATIMCLTFAVLFPIFGLAIYLPVTNKVRWIHAPLQLFALALAIAGLACGVKLAEDLGGQENYTGYHPVIGYVAVGYLGLVQPLIGLKQHLHFSRTKARHSTGFIHTWLGRAVIWLGIINGGLGFKFTGTVGSSGVPRYAVILYSVVVVIVAIIWLTVVLLAGKKDRARRGSNNTVAKEPLNLQSTSSSGSGSPPGGRKGRNQRSTHAERAPKRSSRMRRKEMTEGSGAFA